MTQRREASLDCTWMEPIIGIELAEKISVCLIKNLAVGAKRTKLYFALNKDDPRLHFAKTT